MENHLTGFSQKQMIDAITHSISNPIEHHRNILKRAVAQSII
jgi:hypothetical protein